MVALYERTGRLTLGRSTPVRSDELAARRALRAQVARLDHDLSSVLISAFPRTIVDHVVGGPGHRPRVLGLAELEKLRDDMTAKLAVARAQVSRRADEEAANRELLERMLLAPGEHKFVRIANRDIGEPGCGVWHVRPRLGIIGMLAGWWHVKLSSGCPLGRQHPKPPPLRRISRRWASAVANDRPRAGPLLYAHHRAAVQRMRGTSIAAHGQRKRHQRPGRPFH